MKNAKIINSENSYKSALEKGDSIVVVGVNFVTIGSRVKYVFGICRNLDTGKDISCINQKVSKPEKFKTKSDSINIYQFSSAFSLLKGNYELHSFVVNIKIGT